MRVVIGDKEITLSNRDVRTAKRLVRNFLDTSEAKAEKYGSKTFQYTLLIVMYIMSNDYIQSLTPDVLALVLNAAAENEAIQRSIGDIPYTPLIKK